MFERFGEASILDGSILDGSILALLLEVLALLSVGVVSLDDYVHVIGEW
jgi:hypothetical protein